MKHFPMNKTINLTRRKETKFSKEMVKSYSELGYKLIYDKTEQLRPGFKINKISKGVGINALSLDTDLTDTNLKPTFYDLKEDYSTYDLMLLHMLNKGDDIDPGVKFQHKLMKESNF